MTERTKAQLFTLDLLLALIPLTIALGMSASAISGVATQIQDYTYLHSMQRVASDAIDVLIKTPGNPSNWNSTILPVTAGLGMYGGDLKGTNELDLDKVSALNRSDMQILIGTSNFNLTLTALNGSYVVGSWGSQIPSNASNVVAVEREVYIDPGASVSGGTLAESGSVSKGGGGPGASAVYTGTFVINASNYPGYEYFAVVDWEYYWRGSTSFKVVINGTDDYGWRSVPDNVNITSSITEMGTYGVELYLWRGSRRNRVSLTILSVPGAEGETIAALRDSNGLCRMRLITWR